MHINDLRKTEEKKALLTNQGLGIDRDGGVSDWPMAGDVVRYRNDLYLLCLEAAHQYLDTQSGTMRYFLVGVSDGRRVRHLAGETIVLRPVATELTILDAPKEQA